MMEGNVRRRRRDPAAVMPVQETEQAAQPQQKVEQDLSVQARCLQPAYQRRQASIEQKACQEAVTAVPEQVPVQSAPVMRGDVQSAVRQRRTARAIQIDDEPVQRDVSVCRQEAVVIESIKPEKKAVARTAAVKKKEAPKAAKKKEKPAAAAYAEDAVIHMERKKWVAILLCLFGGMIGLHKFYEKKTVKGILYILTVGFMGIGILLDLFGLIRKPSVYVVEIKRRKPLMQVLRDFRFDIVGYIVTGIGALIISFTIGMVEQSGVAGLLLPASGIGVAAVGAAISYLYTRDLKSTLIVDGVILVGVFAFIVLVAVAFVLIILVIVGLIFDIDVLGFIAQLLSKDDSGEVGAMHSVQNMPSVIVGSDNQRYYYSSGNGSAAVYIGERDRNAVTIHSNDINPSGRSAATMGYVFRW